MTATTWPSEWLRGVLELAVLRVLADGPTYGYAIGVRLDESGFGALKGGTLYPLLSRLEQAGSVAVEWRQGDGGPARKYFALTDSGRATFERTAADWAQFASLVTTFTSSAASAA
ncbi:PadR family transcriptional regulator [Arsenicicoccus piscis]|uniref:Transcriptional regulator n=1 Tax=Arsenicicoccus piscis TaxID=673954 RepID=A0ABQ6HJE4_9MICO|nr:PadR family transcriptional regulator [Arsenicicoccus piscis]MCH8627760.1 PadR family transcriptional regulator [Arsenicicoccus piscis]GMA18275.1 transcriptional regulator [Arsenicicoccus piscis]